MQLYFLVSNVAVSVDSAPDAATSPGLSLANEAQFLLISRESVRSLQKKLVEQQDDDLREVKGQKAELRLISKCLGTRLVDPH